MVHRDIKPENILLTEDGSTLVADFGIARALGGDDGLTQTGLAIGTPAYMSPEQAAGDKALDARTDLYSLASVLYEMLAGEPPYTGPTAQAIMAKRLSEPAPSVRALRPTVPARRGRGDPEGARAGGGGPVRHRGAVRPGAARVAHRGDDRRRAAPQHRPPRRPRSPSPRAPPPRRRRAAGSSRWPPSPSPPAS